LKTDESESAAARPESGPAVRCYDRQGPVRRGCSRVPTAAREQEMEGLPVPWNGGFGLSRPRADASSSLASRADPTLRIKELNSFCTSSRSKLIPAGDGKSGPGPNSSINRWRAPLTAGWTTCAPDMRKRRGAYDERQRRALFGEPSLREDASLRNSARGTTTTCVSHHSGNHKLPLGEGRDLVAVYRE